MLPREKTISVYSVLPPIKLGEALRETGEAARQRLDRLSTRREFQAGSIVFRQNADPASVWVLVSGQARLIRSNGPEDSGSSRKAVVNDICGITETLAGVPFQASLKAVTDCTFQNLSCEQLNEFLLSETELCTALLGALARNYYKGYLKLLSAA